MAWARIELGTLVAVVAVATGLAGCGNPMRFEEPPSGGAPQAVPRERSAAPAVASRPAFHTVQKGETLYAIAFRYGLSTATLARWNDLGDGSLIRAGQRLRLSAPGTTAAAGVPGSSSDRPGASAPVEPPPRWQWPAKGPVIAQYGDSPMTASGIEIGGRLGDPVMAAAPGQVVYAGSGLASYGELLIVKHNESWLTAYGFNQSVLVREGERVAAGQVIARLGEGPGRRPMLHFEIRSNGEPVNPVQMLPPRLPE